MPSDANTVTVQAEAAANRLRLLQADLADESAENRANALYQEVREAVGKILPEQRRQFLQELETRFPTFSDAGAGESFVPKSAPPPDSKLLTDSLVALAASLSPEQKQNVVDRLRDAGFPLVGGELPEQEMAELTRLLQLTPGGAKPDPARSLQLLMVLVEFVGKLDQAVWSSWAQVDPKSDIKRPGPLQRTMGKFLRAEVARTDVTKDSERLLKLTASLIVSLQKIGPGLFRAYFDPVLPDNIAEGVQGGYLKNKEAQCWKRYEERAASMDSVTFNTAMFAAVARFVKDFFSPTATPHANESNS